MPPIKPGARVDNYAVIYEHGDTTYASRVAVIEDYTTLGDIPKILALRPGWEPKDIRVVALSLTDENN